MRFFQVGLCDRQIALYHFHGGVSKDDLEGVGVAAVSQIVDGEGVAKTVGVDAMDAGALAEGLQELEHALANHPPALDGDEEVVASDVFGASCQVR